MRRIVGILYINRISRKDLRKSIKGIKEKIWQSAFEFILSYLVVLVVIAAVGAVAITLGITLRKKKNKKEEMQQTQETADGE